MSNMNLSFKIKQNSCFVSFSYSYSNCFAVSIFVVVDVLFLLQVMSGLWLTALGAVTAVTACTAPARAAPVSVVTDFMV